MDFSGLSQEVREWLERNGWFPGRDIGSAEADELIDVRVRDAERQGNPLVPIDAAVRVIRTFGLLTLQYPRAGDLALEMNPNVGYDGDAGLISELGTNLGQRLFPVGYESEDYGPVLVDELGRFFHLHHTGAYFWGFNEQDAFAHFMSGAQALDAEDFFV
ncbi:SUKH-3 domain-containing protein [Streptomyces flavofungini]|uniref:SUKH-3 domain-containing protein n=1 Tax=Streptomyces flavofungini TaxID=68200 RepID=UPI0025B26EE9|nr:SUKH-3 domain-containing protein [Streptomyces flavofungini]WJV46456.1 SUKH-3 domain-containing protein [Streptomyces flavofungini]